MQLIQSPSNQLNKQHDDAYASIAACGPLESVVLSLGLMVRLTVDDRRTSMKM
jgi:hypothetical protein